LNIDTFITSNQIRFNRKATQEMQRSAVRSALARTTVVGATAAIAVLAAAGPAAAHVTIDAPSTAAGSYTLLTVSVPHGCDGEATTEIAVQVPEPINAVTPSINPNWEVEKVMVDLPEPITDSHGNEITERVDQIVYSTDTPLPDGMRDAFELSLRIPEEAAGQTLYFPVVQTCTGSDHPWIEIPVDGQDPDELASPAPSITVTAAEEGEAEPAADSNEGAAAESESEGGTGPLVYIALAIGMIGAGLGALALVKGRSAA
jgi:uncharacterized protein YcnI